MPLNPGRPIPIAEHHPDNVGVLAYLGRPARGRTPALSARPGDVEDPYMTLGSHPDVVGWLWDRLGAALPEDARCVVLGTPALAEPTSGLVLAVALGTSYALRLTPDDVPAALESGARTVHHYDSVDVTLDVGAWGAGWVFGTFATAEGASLARAFAHARALGRGPWAPLA